MESTASKQLPGVISAIADSDMNHLNQLAHFGLTCLTISTFFLSRSWLSCITNATHFLPFLLNQLTQALVVRGVESPSPMLGTQKKEKKVFARDELVIHR